MTLPQAIEILKEIRNKFTRGGMREEQYNSLSLAISILERVDEEKMKDIIYDSMKMASEEHMQPCVGCAKGIARSLITYLTK